MNTQIKTGWITVLMMTAMASFALAQDLPAAKAGGFAGRGANGFVTSLDQKVGLSSQQKDAVRGLLADQRVKSQALREDTDKKIRGLLNADQQKKFDDMQASKKARFARKS